MTTKSVKLNLLENSQSFFVEAVDKAIGAKDEVRQWQFAILNLVQSLEPSLKVILKTIHPLFIYENIDSPKHTVSVTKAIDRLTNPDIGNIFFTDKEKKGMLSAIEIRNKITHSEFDISVNHAQAQFFKVFSLITTLQRRRFDIQIEEILSSKAIESLIIIEKSREVLVKNANQRIDDEGIDSDFVWCCPNCLSDTFVIQDSIDSCYACTHTEAVEECPHCGELFFEEDFESIQNSLDIGYSECLDILENLYGFNDVNVCSECTRIIVQEVEEKREENERREHEHYHW